MKMLTTFLLACLCAGLAAQISQRPAAWNTPAQRTRTYQPGKVAMQPTAPLRTQSSTRPFDTSNRSAPSTLSQQTTSTRIYRAPVVAKPLLDPDSTASRVINGEPAPVSGAKTADTSGK